jgi:hypothetical protein
MAGRSASRALTRIDLVRRDQLDAGRDVSGYLGHVTAIGSISVS